MIGLSNLYIYIYVCVFGLSVNIEGVLDEEK